MGAAAPRQSPQSSPAQPEVFRPRVWLRLAALFGIAGWLFILYCVITFRGSPERAYLGVAFFITLFAVLGVFYNNTSIEVRGDSVLMKGVLSARLVMFSDILRVDVTPGLLQTTYAVRARKGLLSFTSLFANHQRIVELIVERARLARV